MMQLLWFSPVPPAKTDIANYTRRIAPHLRELVDVVFVHPDGAKPDPVLDSVPISSLSPRQINQADLCVYQIGNNPDFHSQILETAQKYPGLVVLHDRAVHEFLLIHYGLTQQRTGIAQSKAYRTAMGRWYGADGLLAAQQVTGGHSGPAEVASRFPLFEVVLDRALGVVCHNPQLTAELRRRFPRLPIVDLPLPYDVPADVPARPLRAAADPIRLVMFGFMAANRRACEFLHSWNQSDHRDRFELHMAGELSDRPRFDATASQLGLSDRIVHHGFVPDDALDALIASAALVINLRNPSMGEASGSQLRIWANGCPAAVSAAGWYGALPDSCVHKIGLDSEQADLVLLLDDLVHDRLDLDRMVQRGFQQLRAHDPARYVCNLAAWIDANRAAMQTTWAECALIETVAGAYARSLPQHLQLDLPPRLLG